MTIVMFVLISKNYHHMVVFVKYDAPVIIFYLKHWKIFRLQTENSQSQNKFRVMKRAEDVIIAFLFSYIR